MKRNATIMEEVNHLIEVREVAKEYRYGDQVDTAIRQMDLTIDDGDFVAVVGPSGSGKSSLLSVLGGLNQPSRGRVLVDSLDVYGLTNEQRADFRNEYIGMIFQSFQLIPYLTVIENVMLPLAITNLPRNRKKEMAVDVLSRVGLLDKAERLPDQISGGQQERAAIARALVNRPPILLADEPTGNLDSETSREIMKLLSQLNEQDGLTVIMVTHNKENSSFAGKVVNVCDGAIVSVQKSASMEIH